MCDPCLYSCIPPFYHLSVILKGSPKGEGFLPKDETLKAVESIENIIGLFKRLPYERCAVVADILIDFDQYSLMPLCKALGTEDSNTKFWCVRALSEIDIAPDNPFFAEIKGRLSALLGDENYETRGYSAICLAKMQAKEMTGAIVSLLKNDKETFVRSHAAIALGIMQDNSVIKDLIDCIGDKNWDVSHSCARALAQFGQQIENMLRGNLTCSLDTALKRCKEVAEEVGINDFSL